MELPAQLLPPDETVRILTALIESSDDAILAKDLHGTILSWNRGAERIYGYQAAEIVGRPVQLLMRPDAAAELADLLDRVGRGERVERHEAVRVRKDGRFIDVSLTLTPIRDAGGTVIGALAVARDVTDRNRDIEKLRESEARLRSVVDSAVDAIIVIDARGRIESFNPGAERLFGYSVTEVIGQNVNILMPSPYREEHDGYMTNYVDTGIARIIGIGRDVTALRKDGRTLPVRLSVGELTIRGERKFTGILHDLSTRVQMEEQLREQAALVRLGEMAAVIAHEVRNPLAAVRGAIQVIGKRLPAESREAAVTTDIIARIDTLNQLVNDLLLFARPPTPRPIPLDVSLVLAATASLLGEDASYRNVRVEIAGSAPPIFADAELLKIVFINVFINAAQAMRGQGAIRVSVTSAGGMSQIAVADEGPGISPDVRDKLFTPFVTTKSRGTGLGLSTVKRLVEAHHGSIDVECPAGGGTTITIRLPLAAAV
jgi:two-component system, LuxR family, sensor kinase FixL